MQSFKNENSAQRGSFWDGYPADIRGSFARMSWRKTSVRALKIVEQNKHLGADIHDLKVRTSTTLRDFHRLRSEKLWAEFSFPNLRNPRHINPFARLQKIFLGATVLCAFLVPIIAISWGQYRIPKLLKPGNTKNYGIPRKKRVAKRLENYHLRNFFCNFLGLGFRRAHFLRIFIFEKSWSKCKHVFQPKDVTMDAHMLSLSMSA